MKCQSLFYERKKNQNVICWNYYPANELFYIRSHALEGKDVQRHLVSENGHLNYRSIWDTRTIAVIPMAICRYNFAEVHYENMPIQIC